MIPCTCINAKNRPSEIPLSKWIEEGFRYHITHVYYHPGQGIQGVDLHEVKLGKESYPFTTYRLDRFAFTYEAIRELFELMKICTELNDIDIEKLIEESNLETIKL